MVANTARAEGTATEMQTLVAVSAAHLVSHFYIVTLPVLLPLLKDYLSVSFLELGLALTIFNVVTGLTQTPMGFLVDRLGARRVLVVGLLIGGLAFGLFALVPTYPMLLVTAGLAGLANCVYHPADYAIMAEAVPEERSGRAFSIHAFAGYVGFGIVPATLLGLSAFAGLPAAIIFCALLGPVTAIGVLLVPPHARIEHAPGPIKQGAPGKTGALSGILTPAILSLTAFFALISLFNIALQNFSVVALMATQRLTLSSANVALTAYLMFGALGVLAGGALADRTNRHGELAALGFAAAAVIMLLMATLDLSAIVLTVGMGLTGFLSGMMMPSRDMLVRKAAPPGAAGRVFAIVSTGFSLGGAIGPMIFGWVMDHGAPQWVFGITVVLLGITAAVAFVSERRSARAAAAA